MTQSINARINRLADGIDRQELQQLLTSILTDLAALKAAINTHTHDGVTTGSDSTGAADANTMGALNTVA